MIANARDPAEIERIEEYVKRGKFPGVPTPTQKTRMSKMVMVK